MAPDPQLLQPPSLAPSSAHAPALAPEAHLFEEEPAPLVICEGFLCATSHAIWGSFTDELHLGERASRHSRSKAQGFLATRFRAKRPRRAILAPIGPVSSLHDRACELFYALRGGVVDYGREHSEKHGHARFGRTFDKALLPGWAEPGGPRAHFLGHSMGGTTIVELRSLLLRGFFDEALASGSPSKGKVLDGATRFARRQAALASIISITTVSSPLRGTPLVHILGTQSNTTRHEVRPLSLGNALAKACHLTTWVRGAVSQSKGWLPDLHADAWDFAGPFGARRAWGIPSLARQLWRSTWAEGDDCAPWDCAIVQRLAVEAEGAGWGPDKPDAWGAPPCFLRSYAASLTEPDELLAEGQRQRRDEDSQGPQEDEAGRLATLRRILEADYSHGPLSVTARMLERYDYASLDVMADIIASEQPAALDGPEDEESDEVQTTVSSARTSTDSLPTPGHPDRRRSSDLSSTAVADSGYGSEVHTPALATKGLEADHPDKGRAIVKLAEELKVRLLREWRQRRSSASSEGGGGVKASVRVDVERTEATRIGGATADAEALARWRANDGVVPLASQFHPGPCVAGWCVHQEGLGSDLPLPPLSPAPPILVSTARMLGVQRLAEPLLRFLGQDDRSLLNDDDDGKRSEAPTTPSLGLLTPRASETLPAPDCWHSVHLPKTSHTSLCPFWTGSDAQRLFWRDLGAWLESVEVAAGLA